MALLAPIFLLGAVLIGIPIWLHRLKKTSADSTSFSSIMLMEESAERTHVRQAICFKKLLSLRVLLLLLLALAFAKPLSVLPGLDTITTEQTHFVVIDTSPSMAPILSDALAEARDVIGDVPPGQLIQVFAANQHLSPLSQPSLEKNDHYRILEDLETSHVRLDYGQLMRSLGDLASDVSTPVSVHLISDFQNSGLPSNFSDLFVAGLATLKFYPVRHDTPNDWAIRSVLPGDDFVALSVTRPPDAESFEVTWLVNDQDVGSQVFTNQGPFHLPPLQQDWLVDGDNRVTVKMLKDDGLTADNTFHFVVSNPVPVVVPILTASNRSPNSGVFLSSALAAKPEANYVPLITDVAGLDARTLLRHKVVLVEDLMLTAGIESGLRAYLEQGGSILAFIGSESAGQMQQLPVTGEVLEPAQLTAQEGKTVSQINTVHAVTSAAKGWFEIRIDRLPPLSNAPDAEALVTLDDGSPFIVERKIGEGRLITVAGSLGGGDNDFATKPVFAAFVLESVAYLSGHNPINKNLVAGEPVTLSASGQVQVTDPRGERLLSLLDTTRVSSVTLDRLGFYELHSESEDLLVAVNLDPQESDLSPIPDSTLATWEDGFVNNGSVTQQTYELDGEERQREWWPYVLLVLLLVGLGEAIVANSYLGVRSN